MCATRKTFFIASFKLPPVSLGVVWQFYWKHSNECMDEAMNVLSWYAFFFYVKKKFFRWWYVEFVNHAKKQKKTLLDTTVQSKLKRTNW